MPSLVFWYPIQAILRCPDKGEERSLTGYMKNAATPKHFIPLLNVLSWGYLRMFCLQLLQMKTMRKEQLWCAYLQQQPLRPGDTPL